jgi:hypothetical protein
MRLRSHELFLTHLVHFVSLQGDIILNPSPNFVIPDGDELIVIAEDDDTYTYAEAEEPAAGDLPAWHPSKNRAEYILMTGWRRDIRDILKLLDSLVEHGTEVHMLASVPLADRTEILLQEGLDVKSLRNITLVHHEGNSSSRCDLEELPMERYTSVMVLADEAHEHDIMHSDSHNLSSLLLLRNVQQLLMQDGKITAMPPCITEILDSRTQQTISTGSTVFAGSDFVQSNEMISQMLAMISEDPGVKSILSELLGSKGSDISLETPAQYCLPTENLTFMQLAKRCQMKHHILCGYANAAEGTVVNPREKSTPRRWDGGVTTCIVLCPPSNVSTEGDASGADAETPAAAVHVVSNFERLGGMVEERVDRMSTKMMEIRQLLLDSDNGIGPTSLIAGPAAKSISPTNE